MCWMSAGCLGGSVLFGSCNTILFIDLLCCLWSFALPASVVFPCLLEVPFVSVLVLFCP